MGAAVGLLEALCVLLLLVLLDAAVGLLEALFALLVLVLVGAAVDLLEVLGILLVLVEDLVCLVDTGLLFVMVALFGFKLKKLIIKILITN